MRQGNRIAFRASFDTASVTEGRPRHPNHGHSARKELKDQASIERRKRRATFSAKKDNPPLHPNKKTRKTKQKKITSLPFGQHGAKRRRPWIALQERPRPNPGHSRGKSLAVMVADVTGGSLDLGVRNERLGAREILARQKPAKKKSKIKTRKTGAQLDFCCVKPRRCRNQHFSREPQTSKPTQTLGHRRWDKATLASRRSANVNSLLQQRACGECMFQTSQRHESRNTPQRGKRERVPVQQYLESQGKRQKKGKAQKQHEDAVDYRMPAGHEAAKTTGSTPRAPHS